MRREEFEKEYRKNIEEIPLPDILKKDYRCESCLKERTDTKTLLVYKKDNRKPYILKIAEHNRGRILLCEKNILSELRHAGIENFPMPLLFMKEGESVYYLREYIEGKTLFELVKRKGCMSENVLCLTGIRLCRLLEILHSQQLPVIHRDIKPENIIYTRKHTFTLTDFETARKYSPEKEHDTYVMGSRPTAAPEQFGYAQTDQRTDIYGLGMTMNYLACGTYERKDLKKTEISGGLRKIIYKATSFDPDKRYQSAGQLCAALMRHRNKMMIGNRQHIVGNDTGFKRRKGVHFDIAFLKKR